MHFSWIYEVKKVSCAVNVQKEKQIRFDNRECNQCCFDRDESILKK